MPSRKLFGSVGEASPLLEKASSVIERFGSKDPAIAPPSLCGIYSLLHFLDENNIHIRASESQLEDLGVQLQQCTDLLEQHDPVEEGSLLFTWPMSTETHLKSLLETIDSKLVRLRYHRPIDEGASVQPDYSPEPPSVRALNGASNARRRERKDSLKNQPIVILVKLRKQISDTTPRSYEMQQVNIADKDDESRVLQFTSTEPAMVISHRIKKGTLPYTDNDLCATNTNFNQPQTLVIKNNQGYQIDSFRPRYEFKNAGDLKQFISTVRERELLGQFMPDLVYRNKDKHNPLARCKVVRVWLKTEKRSDPTLTITFENSLANGEQKDWDVGLYRYPDMTSRRDGVEFRTIDPPDEKITFLFDGKNSKPAKELHDLINARYPHRPKKKPSIGQAPYPTGSPRPDAGQPWSWAGSSHGSTTSASGARSSTDLELNTTSSTQAPTRTPFIPGANFMHEPQGTSPLTPTATFGTSPPAPRSRATTFRGPQMPRSRADFEVAIICALPLETDAVEAVFDQEWDHDYGKIHGDRNYYSFGSIGSFNVVLVHMGGMGKISATTAAINCCQSFTGLKLGLVVGICGGIPYTPSENEIVLGDVVISDGVVQYDFGREYPEGFSRRAERPFEPDVRLRPLLNKLKGRRGREKLQEAAMENLRKLEQVLKNDACYPKSAEDKLFDSTYRHRHRHPDPCTVCTPGPGNLDRVCDRAPDILCSDLGCASAKILRCIKAADSRQPAVHFGMYASGDKVMKSGEQRDLIAAEEKIIAFEMEGAAVWEHFESRCLVIKGVCDYADSHKSKGFQKYAAATAAAFMKAFLASWSSSGDDIIHHDNHNVNN